MKRLVLVLILVLAACGGATKQIDTKSQGDGMQAGLESVAQLVDSAFVAVQLGLDEVAGR